MKDYIQHDEWCVIERGFNPELNEVSESLCSIGNGRMGQRANFEERYTGKTLQGSYVAGVYYPDKTRVGWWKNGYPEYFAKVLNAANWIGIDVEVDGEVLDLALCEVTGFERILNMKEGVLYRNCTVKTATGKVVKINSTRFCSIVNDEIGAIKYSLTPVNFSGKITVTPYVDADVKNKDSNYDEKFWIEVMQKVKRRSGVVVAETKKTKFQVATAMRFDLYLGENRIDFDSIPVKSEKYISCHVDVKVKQSDTLTVYKYGANLSSENHPIMDIAEQSLMAVRNAQRKGFDALLDDQKEAWFKKWESSDIIIEGDVAAQQGIRFNIFHMMQTYTGEDERLNIGPKGFTGEKYGGSTYWDTEAYCLPFYLATADQKVARQLLVYRYKHLQKAIENAAKLGFTDGAALYPMVTMNGEECHNEWEITFEEIHRNGAIAYAIFDYIRYTNDTAYLAEYGAEVLLGIARFWAQRVHFSERKGMYVMHGVTGPNEYDNNVSNNWYTNYIAKWCLSYAKEALEYVKKTDAAQYKILVEKTSLDTKKEFSKWDDICAKMFLPHDEQLNIWLQQEDYMDKEQILVKDLDEKHRPLNQKWSWDRILRSCFIKQADVLQGMYFFEDDFSLEDIRRNFEFYEPRTVHESSLSPCVHVILAAALGMNEKAYEMYLRTARLDLDDYNNDTEDGLHITSMAGTWMSVVKGFGGMRVKDNTVHFNPFLPKQWKGFAFKVNFRANVLEVKVTKKGAEISNISGDDISIIVAGKNVTLKKGETKKG
jgi:maltose phosphorylase